MASKTHTPESNKVGEGTWRPKEVGPTVGKGVWVNEEAGNRDGDKIILKGLENLPENLPSSPTPTLTPNSPFFTNFLSALF